MMKNEKRRELTNALVQDRAMLEAVQQAAQGKEVSDFIGSYITGGRIMKDEDRKILTGFLGEGWHKRVWRDETGKPAALCSCGFDEGVLNLCVHLDHANRTFDNWNDFGALKDGIVRKGKMPEFIRYVVQESREASVKRAWEWWTMKNPLVRCILIRQAIKEGVLK